MSELAELYAACIVEYASRQPNGTLAGNFSVLGTKAGGAFDLPYNENTSREAIEILENIGVLTQHRHKNVPTHYSVRRSAFDNSMIVEGNGLRRYEERLGSAPDRHVAINVARLTEEPRNPTILESYADLGSSYLVELLAAYESELDKIGNESELSVPVGIAQEIDTALPLSAVVAIDPTSDSTDWTGLSSRISSKNLTEIKQKIVELNSAIIQSDADDRTKLNATKRIAAVQSLLEAPDVPWREVIEILSSPALASFLSVLSAIQFILGFAN